MKDIYIYSRNGNSYGSTIDLSLIEKIRIITETFMKKDNFGKI